MPQLEKPNVTRLMPIGAEVDPAGGVHFRVWAPSTKVVSVQLGATEKLYADYMIVATNPGGHSSLPRPDNAIYELTAALDKLQAAPFAPELNAVTRSFFERDAKIEPKDVAADMHALTGATLDVNGASHIR